MNTRLIEADFEYPVSENCTKIEGGIEFIDKRIATRIVGLCQGTRYCRDCDCREIIQSCGIEVTRDGYVEKSRLHELREALEKKFLV